MVTHETCQCIVGYCFCEIKTIIRHMYQYSKLKSPCFRSNYKTWLRLWLCLDETVDYEDPHYERMCLSQLKLSELYILSCVLRRPWCSG